MGINLYTAKVYQLQLSGALIPGDDSKEAMYDLFQEFEISHNADDEFDDEYDLARTELKRFRDEIVNHSEYFQERAQYFAEKLEKMNLTEKQFIHVLDRLINESDQTNENVLLSWF